MATAAALTAAAILLALAAFQARLAAGRPLGRFAWGGAHDVLPPPLRVASAASILVYALMALILLDAAEVTTILPGDWVGTAVWILAAYFLIGVAMNAASRSADERRVMTPVALALCLLCVGVAVG